MQQAQWEKKDYDLAKDFKISLFFFSYFHDFCVYNLMPNSDTAEYPSKILIPFNHKKNKSFAKQLKWLPFNSRATHYLVTKKSIIILNYIVFGMFARHGRLIVINRLLSTEKLEVLSKKDVSPV